MSQASAAIDTNGLSAAHPLKPLPPNEKRSIPADFLLDVVFTLIPILILIIFRLVQRRYEDLVFAPDFSYATMVFFGLSIARAQRLRRNIREDEESDKIMRRQIYLIVLLCVSLVFLFFAIAGPAGIPAHGPPAPASKADDGSTSNVGRSLFAIVQFALLIVSIYFVWGDYRFRLAIEESKYQRTGQDGLSFCAYARESLEAAWQQLAFAALHLQKLQSVPEFVNPPEDQKKKLLLWRALESLRAGIRGTAQMGENIEAIELVEHGIAQVIDRVRPPRPPQPAPPPPAGAPPMAIPPSH